MTHKQRVLALLSDGKAHTHHELYGLHVIAHSRIADLRRDGHRIEQWREGDLYFYRLSLEQATVSPGAVASSSEPFREAGVGQGCSTCEPSGETPQPASPSGQLVLDPGQGLPSPIRGRPASEAGTAGVVHPFVIVDSGREPLPGRRSLAASRPGEVY